MERPLSAERLEDLVLVRTAVPIKSGMTATWYARSLERFAPRDVDPSAWSEQVGRALDALIEHGFVHSPAKTTRSLTDSGRERVRDLFGGKIPAPRTRWITVCNAWLPALAMGLQKSPVVIDRMREASGLRGVLLRHRCDLPLSEAPTERQALDAMVWRALGVETDRPLSVCALHEHVLKAALGGVRVSSVDQLSNLYAARLTEARGADPAAIRSALVQKLLHREGGKDNHRPPPAPEVDQDVRAELPSIDVEDLPPPSVRPAVEAEVDGNAALRDFSQAVRSAAFSPDVQRFGPNKAFIASVFDSMPAESDLSAFKRRLIAAHRAGLLRLRAANLVDAMDPDLVRRSESVFMNSHFHFVEVEP